MWNNLPAFGSIVLCAILVSAAYTFGVALAAGAGRPRLLQAARYGAYGTISLVGLAVLVLAYAFVTHDFRLEYVARYSDRTMDTPWLIAALWGGQDGSLLWWLFLTSVFSGLCIAWLKSRYRVLQPYIIATQMSVLLFLAILMLFAANPFRLLPSGAVPDGSGLNYQLRNFYMIIHPPSLYVGFTSAVVPFSFAIAALATGRLDNEWIIACRKWMLFCWLFLSIGNALGMAWAYEELGWGGYWAWDPVENAAFLPWLTASAYVHSTMIEERRGMLKMWNIILICLTFFLTYFGTFLTRSGLIASVHSFAQSGIGTYFVWYMVVIIAACTALIVHRHAKLKSEGQFDSALAREFAFLANNWILLSLMIFIAVATVWPRISEWLLEAKSTVGPTFYNAFIPPAALVLIFLMGTAPLLGWRKTSKELFYRSFRWPLSMAGLAVVLHLALGERLGFPPFFEAEPAFFGRLGEGLAWLQGKLPLVTVGLVAYNITVVLQEVQRGVSARRRKPRGEPADEAAGRTPPRGRESIGAALFQLVSKSRRRYGGYTVHIGVAIMFLGFAGRAWGVDREASLAPGETMEVGNYALTYVDSERRVNHEYTGIYAHLDISKDGRPLGRLSPHKRIYKASPGQPSTEVAKHVSARDDLYVIVGIINPQTKMASFQVHINPLVSLVWLGVAILILGAVTSMWPEVTFQAVGTFGYVRALGSVSMMVMLSIALAVAPSLAYGQQHEMRREGVVTDLSVEEKTLFKQLLCDCGTCPHEPLHTCTCGWAHNAREEVKKQLAAGKSQEQIVADYAAAHGNDAVVVRPNQGGNQAMWVLPLLGSVLAGGVVFWRVRSWVKKSKPAGRKTEPDSLDRDARDVYDDRLDDELRELE